MWTSIRKGQNNMLKEPTTWLLIIIIISIAFIGGLEQKKTADQDSSGHYITVDLQK